jgi:GTP cyclohydrolase II
LALVLGETGKRRDVLVRVHSECVTGDKYDKTPQTPLV